MHFCWNCKSRVEQPWVYTGGHLPNEGHDSTCRAPQTYMEPRRAPQNRTNVNHGGRNLSGKNNAGKQYTYNRPGQGSYGNRPGQGAPVNRAGNPPARGTQGRRNTGLSTLILVIIVFWIVIQFIMGLAMAF